MKKKHLFLAAFAATMLTPTIAWAQYPQISGEAKENYTKMMTEERKRSDEAWAKALPIVQKEAWEGRPYIPWAGRPYDLPQADIPSFPGAEGGGMYSFGGMTADRGLSVKHAKQVALVLSYSMLLVSSVWNHRLSSVPLT